MREPASIAGFRSPRGVWRLEVLADVKAAPLAAKTFLVEDFLPERIDFDLSLAETPIRLGDAPALSIDARYLFGAPGADLAIEGEVLLRAAEGLAGFPGYVFGRGDEPFSPQMTSFEAGLRTDAAGRFTTGAALYSLRGNTHYTVTGFDPATGGKARTNVYVRAGQDNAVSITLLGRGNLDVLVLRADGSPAAGAAVEALDADEVRGWLAAAHALVAAKLTRRARAELGLYPPS
jgi:hypothetical protein